jgi:hypothetical protein
MSTVLADAPLSADPGAAATAAVASPPEVGGISYSKASYYTVLGLYLLSFPGLWSTVKRSTAAKVKNKTFITKGEASPGGKGLREQAGEIMACTLRVETRNRTWMRVTLVWELLRALWRAEVDLILSC